ncbi:hypothetical protein MJC1_04233 [Methylocystis sp. MJC1]|jgi:hypothetical protein|nr:hypothetical protein MJC1_04233 [Methylocystis sp. MJC1]
MAVGVAQRSALRLSSLFASELATRSRPAELLSDITQPDRHANSLDQHAAREETARIVGVDDWAWHKGSVLLR